MGHQIDEMVDKIMQGEVQLRTCGEVHHSWACNILGLSPHGTITKDSVEREFLSKKQSYPNKSDKEYFHRLEEARRILLKKAV